MSKQLQQQTLSKSLGTWEVMVAGIALVVAASTLVSDFNGFFTLGGAFAVALLFGFIINLFLGLSAADLSVSYPRAGALYDYARAIFKGRRGAFLGVFLGLSFFGVSAFAVSGEAAAGAFGLQALFNTNIDISYYIIILYVLAVIPNIFGIRTTAWVSAGLLLLMLGIRWFFGIAGFLGIGDTGSWSTANLDAGIGMFDWFGAGGILAGGLALAFWSFVGIEFACSLAEEVKAPRKSLPRGIIAGLVIILATSLIMGLGVTGSAPLEVWQTAMKGSIAAGGEAPQLAVGYLMFGDSGYLLMALASVAATLGSLVVIFAAVPRVLYSIAREGYFFGKLSTYFGRLHPRYGTPVVATIFSLALFLIPAIYNSAVIDWVFSAAYAWIILYVAFHLLALANRKLHPANARAFQGRWFVPMAITGIVATLIGLYFAFADAHFHYGIRALAVLGGALTVTAISFALSALKIPSAAVRTLDISDDEVFEAFLRQTQPVEESEDVNFENRIAS